MTVTQAFLQQNPYLQRPAGLSKAFVVSLALHLLLVLGFTLQAFVFSNRQPLIFESAVRVDLVALPDKLKPGPQIMPDKVAPDTPPVPVPPPKTEEVKVKDTPPPSVVLKSNQDKLNKIRQQQALKKLKQMDAIERLKAKMESEQRLQQAAKIYKGNQISKGSDLKGLTAIEHDNYVSQVKKKIYSNWALPQWLAQKQLKAQVLLQIDEQGNIVGKKVFKSSGNPAYDDAVLDSVAKSSPLPSPPGALVKLLSSEGILVGFPD